MSSGYERCINKVIIIIIIIIIITFIGKQVFTLAENPQQ